MELNKKWLSDQILSVKDNYSLTAHYLNQLYLICVNRFIWKNLPKHIDVDFVEKELANNGELAFINHPLYGFQITYCLGDYLNMYGRPQRYLCWTTNNEINEYFKAEDIVIIRNNKLSEPSYDFIRRYATILGEQQKMKEVNLNAVKTPTLIQCDESQDLTMKNLYAQYEGNQPVIYARKSIDLEGIKVFKTDAPYLADKIQADKMATLNECLMFQGINTAPDKKERLVTNEVDANNDMTNICLSLFLNTRIEARDQINEKFGSELPNGKIELELAEYCKIEFEAKQEPKKEDITNE